MRASINDPQYWLERSKEARAIAELMTDAVARADMLSVADTYAGLARVAAERPLTPQSDLP